MQSASTTGSPVRAATMKLCSEFAPPISSDITATKGRPSRSASTWTGRAATSGSGRRSSPTSGAPIVETTATRSSSARALAGTTTGRNPRDASARRVRSEWYGFPPPPAPRIQAPAARSSISVGVSSLTPSVMRRAILSDSPVRQTVPARDRRPPVGIAAQSAAKPAPHLRHGPFRGRSRPKAPRRVFSARLFHKEAPTREEMGSVFVCTSWRTPP